MGSARGPGSAPLPEVSRDRLKFRARAADTQAMSNATQKLAEVTGLSSLCYLIVYAIASMVIS